MTAKKIDRILLALGTVLILISSYQLFFRGFETDSGPKLGTLTSALSIVKTKSAVALDWRDASRGIDVTENQLIYTDNASSAEVVFNEGNALEIGENSLVKLRSSGNEQGMDVSKGFIRARLEGNKPIKVQMNGEDYLLSGENADIQINIQKSKGEIGVISGEVKLESQGITENLTPESAMEINGDQITKKKIVFKTLLPEKNSAMYVASSPSPVTFTWEPDTEASIKISRKPDLDKARTYKLASGSSIDLTPGLWYYRTEGAEGTSLISSFRVILEVAPKILRPRNGESVSLLEDKIVLQWQSEQQDKFLVEWNDGEIHSTTTEHPSAVVNVKSGAFSWRVKIANDNRPLAAWSEWQNISVNVVPVPQVPSELMPHEVEYQTYETPNEKIEFSWKGSGSFELEIKDPAGTLASHKVGGTSHTYEARKAGEYQWRIRSHDDYLRISEWSEWKTFKIEDLSQLKEAEGIQRIQLKKPDQSVTFNWSAEKGTTSIFELAKDSQFKTIVKKIEITKDTVQVSVPEVGAYYWRSRQYKPDGSFEVSEPKRVIIEPVPAPDKPEKLPDLEIELDTKSVRTTFLQKFFDFLIPSAHAEDVKGVIKLDLPVKEEAKGYIVRIYRDSTLTELVFEEKLSSKEFIWKDARKGEYYWQYAVIDFWDRTSLFSDPSRLIVKDESFAPEKPRLLSPIRAGEVDIKDLTLRWTPSQVNKNYRVEISTNDDFKNVLATKTTKENSISFSENKLEPKLHYWRVFAINNEGEVVSNTGRFVILPPIEKKIFIDTAPKEFQKVWKSRAFLGWSPSMDSYKFEDGESGSIDGNAMMGFFLSGTMFREEYVLNAELIRQTGEVFESEKYLFQRGLLDAVYLFGRNANHKWGAGIALGQTSAFGYSIKDEAVKSESVSSFSYGATLKNYYSINENWELQGKLLYLSGDIATMELGGDIIRAWKDYQLLGGATYSTREYKVSEGKQTSIRFTLGIGKEF